jgi:hypothetical protein
VLYDPSPLKFDCLVTRTLNAQPEEDSEPRLPLAGGCPFLHDLAHWHSTRIAWSLDVQPEAPKTRRRHAPLQSRSSAVAIPAHGGFINRPKLEATTRRAACYTQASEGSAGRLL